MSVITLGLSEILVGEAAPNGTMPADNALTKIGKTYQDSCKFTQGASDVTEHKEEGKASPEVRKKRKKMPSLTFSLMDPDAKMLSDYIGGTYTAPVTGPPAVPAKWGFDGTEEVLNRSLRVKTEQGLWFDIPNGDMEVVMNADFSQKGILLLDFTVTPMSVSAGKALVAYVGA